MVARGSEVDPFLGRNAYFSLAQHRARYGDNNPGETDDDIYVLLKLDLVHDFYQTSKQTRSSETTFYKSKGMYQGPRRAEIRKQMAKKSNDIDQGDLIQGRTNLYLPPWMK